MIVDLTTNTSKDVWKQERLVIRLSNKTNKVHFWTNIAGSYNNPIAIYTPDADGYVLIDVTDYLRTYASSITNFYVQQESSSTQIALSVTIKGLISPESVIIPSSNMRTALAGTGILCPPSYMIEPINSLTTKTEVYGYSAGSIVFLDDSAHYISSSYMTTNAVTIPNNTETIQYYSGGNVLLYSQFFQSLQCGKRYAAVRWESFTGQTRQHTFEVEKCKMATKSTYSLMPIQNEYIDIKGREDSFILHMQGLNNYDLWYYADVLNSSKVELSFDGTNFDQVQITTSDITIPDGEAGTKGELDINVNWKRYDAVAM